MITKLEKENWKNHQKRYDILFKQGIKMGLIRPYDQELIENLRHIYYRGLSASILLLHKKLSNGYCYDRGKLITLGFKDDNFKVIDADIDSLRLNPKFITKYKAGDIGKAYANHCFAERTLKNGTTWVYDTSIGLIYEKKLYYRLENPQITKINDRKATQEYLYYDFLRDSNIEKDKYNLPMILPKLEKNLLPTQPFYLEVLKEEIKILKKEIKYEELCKEIYTDIRKKRFI